MTVEVDGGGGGTEKLYARSVEDFYNLADAFSTASNSVFNAEESFMSAQSVGDDFGHGSADAAYSDAYNQVQRAIQNLSNTLQSFSSAVNSSGLAIFHIDAQIGMGPQ
jgi:uncharacterized protein YukE